jgi:hypothetical protein
MLVRRRTAPFLLSVPCCLAALAAQEPSPPQGQEQAPPSRRSALDRAAQKPGTPTMNQGALPVQAQAPVQGGNLTGPLTQLMISLDVMTAFGSSTARDDAIGELQGGAHDPRKRGFTLQQAEIQMNGAVDPYFRGQFVLVSSLEPDEGETIVEVEEAWLVTQQLPYNLQVKGGHYLTDFGRLNQIHPHAWDFQDQPVMMTRVFGADGLRAPGARVSYLAPMPTYLEFLLGVQNANGETLQSFNANDEVYEERPVGGRFLDEDARVVRSFGDMLWHGRVATATDFDPAHTLGGGVSALFGPNATGGSTRVWGTDFMYRWRPIDNRRGYPFFKLQGELFVREFEANEQTDEADPLNPITLPEQTLRDQGGYLYAVYGFAVGWAFGLRGEYATGSGGSYRGGGTFDRAQDPFRCDRLRVSPMLSYQTSEYSRLRLQYNYDDSDHLDDEAHSFWLGFEILLGPHQPHTY